MTVTDYPWSDPVIAAALVRQTFQRKCLVVVPNCMWTGHECDLLCVEPRLATLRLWDALNEVQGLRRAA